MTAEAQERAAEQEPGLFAAVRLEVRPCLRTILGCAGLLRREFALRSLGELVADLEKIETAAQNFMDLFDRSIDPAGNPLVAPGSDLHESIRTMRHDLRTPVGHLIGYAEMIQEEVCDGDHSDLEDDLETLCGSARQLLNLVNGSIDISMANRTGQENESSGALRPVFSGESTSIERVEAEVLVVDDNESNRDLLTRYLERYGITVTCARDGREAIQRMEGANFDLVLLDIMMPVMNGYEVLDHIKADEQLSRVPVIMVSAADELDSVVRCIQRGAADFLHKPINPVLLDARLHSCLQTKRLRDQEQHYLQQVEMEQAKSEALLLNILPGPVAGRLKRKHGTIADNFPEASVLFADIISFTDTSAKLSPQTLVKSLNLLFSAYDALADAYGVEKIKTIGDAYMAAAGIPIPREDHARVIVEMALDMIEETERLEPKLVHPFRIRVGVSSGPVTAGVIGRRKFCYDLWGDTVNTASRMSSIGNFPHVRVTEDAYDIVREHYSFGTPEELEVKGKGIMKTYVVTGRTSGRLHDQ